MNTNALFKLDLVCNFAAMIQQPIFISSLASTSALGNTATDIWKNYKARKPLFSKKDNELVSEIKNEELFAFQQHPKFKRLDKTVLLAMIASDEATAQANWQTYDFGINFGSSRGATELFEDHHQEFLQIGETPPLTSPTTTLGNISSWVAQYLQVNGPLISHSITCSTGMHSLLNGIAWLRAGMSKQFLIGASEAPLTPFTIAQMKAIRLYTNFSDEFPCKTLDLTKKENTLILGEGAVAVCLSLEDEKARAKITGIGYATEQIKHSTSISKDGRCFQDSMRMALQGHQFNEIDAIVMHAPGTVRGDISEYNAIKAVFNEIPLITSNKYLIGHTFGTSGLLSLEMAILMLENNEFIGVPFIDQSQEKPLKKILVNSVGFGGNAVSIIIEC